MKNIAIILAGGKGMRFENSLPKQFFKILNKTVIEYSIEAFETNKNIDEIAVVIHKDYFADIEEITIRNNYKKVKKILAGGDERYMSSLAAIKNYENCEECNLIFHDAVRPLVSANIINRVIAALENYNAVATAIACTDTIIEVEGNGELIHNIPNRGLLRRIQTPQAFKLSTIAQAYNIAIRDLSFTSTDDCGVVKKYLPNEKIYIVQGDERNIKITYKEDIMFVERLLG